MATNDGSLPPAFEQLALAADPTSPLPAPTTISQLEREVTPAISSTATTSERQEMQAFSDVQQRPIRPSQTPRSFTAPGSSSLLHNKDTTDPDDSMSHRRSPYTNIRAVGHSRSRSSGTVSPYLTRAHSSPSIHTKRAFELSSGVTSMSRPLSAHSLPSSPSRSVGSTSPVRAKSPFRPTTTTAHSRSEEIHPLPMLGGPARFEVGNGGGAFEVIEEESELDINPQSPLPPLPSMHATMPRSSSLRRRPASPLHSVMSAQQPSVPASTFFSTSAIDHNPPANFSMQNQASAPSYSGNSPSLGPQKYNEAYPNLQHHASNTSIASSFSSFPSTPTSARSRSPSISSLDTIEDVPDLESEAMEMERLDRLKLAAERAEAGIDEEDAVQRRSSFDTPRGFGFGVSRGRADQRKRWSICGGERRADLDLETIWED